MVDRLLQLLKQIDTARGDRLDGNPEIEELYNESIGLQGQINALIKKYSDQKGESSSLRYGHGGPGPPPTARWKLTGTAELEHMNANFLRAMKQYEDLRNPQRMSSAPR